VKQALENEKDLAQYDRDQAESLQRDLNDQIDILQKDLAEAKSVIEIIYNKSESTSTQLMDKISELENKVKETEAKVRSSVNKYDNMHNQY